MEGQETKVELEFSSESYEWGQDRAAAQGTVETGSFVTLLLRVHCWLNQQACDTQSAETEGRINETECQDTAGSV